MKAIVFDIDGVLIDVRPSFYRIVRELSGATFAEIRRFKDNGGFNDDWELSRAACAWIRAGRPEIFGRVRNWQDVIGICGNDPGDLTDRCVSLYQGGLWRDEIPMVTSEVLNGLAQTHRVVACTGRSRWELARAQELLGFTFHAATTCEEIRKPNPDALLRLLPAEVRSATMFGDSEDDRRTVEAARARSQIEFRYHHVVESPEPILRALLGDVS